jgi:hypothetical protein
LAAVGEAQVEIEDLPPNKRQKWRCEKQQKKRRKQSEEKNAKGTETGKAATERR